MRIAIIGSGIGGAVLADLFAGHHHVTIFERGPDRPEVPAAAITPDRPLGLRPSYAYGLGGTTNYWHGGMIDMFAAEMGPAWPADIAEDLERIYGSAVRHLYGERMRKAYAALPPVRRDGDVRPGFLLYPPAPFRAAGSGFLTMADLRLGHRVERLEERHAGVDVVSVVDGERRSEHFDRVIVAAGGLGSPVILEQSGLGGVAVGANLTDHPMGFVAKLKAADPSAEFRRLRRGDPRHPGAAGLVKIRDDATGLWSAFYLRAASGGSLRSDPYKRSFGFLAATSKAAKYGAALPHLRDPDFLYQALENQLGVVPPSRHAYVMVVNEQEATGQGRVTTDHDGRLVVDWHISEDVEAAIRRNLHRLAVHVDAELIRPPGDLRERMWTAAHYSGTCRIADDPAAGVVDRELRVHGTDNVFVCDGSVLPSTGASNTGLTIASLAHRLARSWLGETRIVTPRARKRLAISGVSGAVGRMLRARLADSAFDWHAVDLRSAETAVGSVRGAVFLHLANASGSVDDNVAVQQRAARFADAAGIDQVVVPMSFSTLEAPGGDGIRADAFNLGFTYTGSDPYPQGKLAAERFWLEWQAAKPGRRLMFAYVPTIIGPRSAWTRNIAKHAGGKTMLVPGIDRFLAVSESDLVDYFFKLAKTGLAPGVTRAVTVSTVGSLPDAIAADRGATVRTVALSDKAWSFIERGYGGGLWYKALSAGRVLGDRVLRAAGGKAVVPISVRYLHLFRRQSDFADRFEAVNDVERGHAVGTERARERAVMEA